MKRRSSYVHAKPFDFDSSCNHNGEKNMWAGIILQACYDACSISNTSEYRIARDEAIRWFTKAGLDFKEVCSNAGLEPDYVQRHALKTIAAGKRFILGPGESENYLRNKKNRDKNQVREMQYAEAR